MVINNKFNYKGVFIHESSYIDEEVEIGKGTNIWHFSHILKNTKIGENCNFGQNVSIGPNVMIGNQVKIQNNVSIYEGVLLEDNVFCGPSCVFTNDKYPRSRNYSNKDKWLKTIVKKGASIGANATIVCDLTINSFAVVGAGSLVREDVPQYALVVGVPAKQIGWVCECSKKLNLPISGYAQSICPQCNQYYELKKNIVTKI